MAFSADSLGWIEHFAVNRHFQTQVLLILVETFLALLAYHRV